MYYVRDQLDAQKTQQETYDNYDVRSFGLDRYRTEGMWDSMDRLDLSIKGLNDRRNYQASRLL